MCALTAVCAAAMFASDPPPAGSPSPSWSDAPKPYVLPPTTPSEPTMATGGVHPSELMPSTIAPPTAHVVPVVTEAAPPLEFPPAVGPAPSWSLHADAVFLRPRWPDLELGIANRLNLGVPNGMIDRLEFDPATGFKLGLHRHWGHDAAFRAEHTYLSADTQNAVYALPGGTVTPTLTHPLGLRDVAAGFGNARHKSNVLDLLWSRRIHSAGCFEAWLEGGPRAAWLRREFRIEYLGGDADPIAQVYHENAFRGFGLGGGFVGRWRLGAGWAVDAGGRVSLLASRNQSGVFETGMRGAALLADANDARTGFTSMLDLHAGLTKAMGAWTFAIGYQMQQWFGVSELLTFNDDVHVGSLDRRRGDFGMDGLFLRLGVSF
jgi:hypothetical protein